MNLLATWRKMVGVTHQARPSEKRARPVAPALWQQDDLLLREFSFAHDADAVCSFQRDTYGLNFPGFVADRHFLNAFRQDLRHAANDPTHGVFVIEKQGCVVAFLWLVIYENSWTGENYGYINNIYVAPEMRGQGLGKRLMNYAERYFRQRDIYRIRLTVTASNEVAVHLYQSQGYAIARYEMEKTL